MSQEKTHDLYDFMRQLSNEMAAEYDRIQKRTTEDPGTAGDQGEENWADLLRGWLPRTYEVVTKGRIIWQHIDLFQNGQVCGHSTPLECENGAILSIDILLRWSKEAFGEAGLFSRQRRDMSIVA